MKILTIGNSFTWSLRSCFPAIAEEQKEELKLEFANFGGCEFRRHWAYITAEENEPCCKMYKEYTMKLRELLASDDWDVVTIQSASHESWDYANYTPFAGLIIDYVKKHAPGAKIIIQQTWAYREDAPRLAEWGFDRNEMYRRLDQAYRKLGTEYNLPIIPTGKAVELALAEQPCKFVNYDPDLLLTLRWPDLPPQANSIVGACSWRKDPATGEMTLRRDTIHLNIRGQYLQACVWYGFLFNKDPRDIQWVHEEVSGSDAAFLRSMAARALKEF
ncbi:MAG: DUF4886 domain-containing protein [Lentisphaerae bacterium]|nr:DUF4886 domain-containing protein [Lentisphaerota bacterium]